VQVTVDDVLDLTSRWTRVRHGISLATLTGDAPADLAACRGLARREVLGGRYGAILAPSAAPGGGAT
jgi:hypothetical protein